MATAWFVGREGADVMVDYHVASGAIRSVRVGDVLQFDRETGVDCPGWRTALVTRIQRTLDQTPTEAWPAFAASLLSSTPSFDVP
jgi:hypothetical protein